MTVEHLGSPRVVTNQNGELIKRTDWMAFGEEVEFNKRTSGLGYDEVPETRKGYTGYEKDEESGLGFAQARYYNPKHGRYTSVDPLTASANVKNPQTFNRYTYVLNSPYKFTDPLGLISSDTGANGSAWCSTCDSHDGPGGFLEENWAGPANSDPAPESTTNDTNGPPSSTDPHSSATQQSTAIRGDLCTPESNEECINVSINVVEDAHLMVNQVLEEATKQKAANYFTGIGALLNIVIEDKNGKRIKGVKYTERNVTRESPVTSGEIEEQTREGTTDSDGRIVDIAGFGRTGKEKAPLDNSLSDFDGAIKKDSVTWRSEQTLTLTLENGSQFEIVWERKITNVGSKGLNAIRPNDDSNFEFSHSPIKITKLK